MAIVPNQREMGNLRRLLEAAREEDLGDGDITAALLPAGVQSRGLFTARQQLVVCGAALLEAIAAAYDERIQTAVRTSEGRSAGAGDVIAEWSGPARSILAGERVALNFLQRLCGVATATRATRAGVIQYSSGRVLRVGCEGGSAAPGRCSPLKLPIPRDSCKRARGISRRSSRAG